MVLCVWGCVRGAVCVGCVQPSSGMLVGVSQHVCVVSPPPMLLLLLLQRRQPPTACPNLYLISTPAIAAVRFAEM